MGLAQSAVAFDHTVTTAFGNGLAQWGFIETVFSQGLALWSTVAVIGSQGLTLWSFIIAVFNQTFLFQAITAAFCYSLTLWGTVAAVSRHSLAEHRVAGFHLWGSLIGSGQGESSAG